MCAITLNRTALHEQICEAIRDRIVLGEFEPGQRLNIDQLARDMGVSTTPVREALARLISERLVLFQPNKGYTVTPPPDAGWLADLFNVRMLFEPYAAGIGAALGDLVVVSELERLQAQIAALDLADPYTCQRYVKLNQIFHTTIIDSAGNKALSDAYKTLSYHAQIVLVYQLGLQDIPQVLEEHMPILRAYHATDGPCAEEAMRVHILEGKNRAVSFLSRSEAAAAVALLEV
ncbi:MAG: GntR family transcriptional regulator [Chloroflexota bacterium]